MKIITSLVFILSFSSILFAKAIVVPTSDYNIIFDKIAALNKQYDAANILVVFDIDDTLLVINHCEKDDGSLSKGIGKLFYCPSEHTEKHLAKNIQRIQSNGIHTIALTARGANLIKVTQRELARENAANNNFNYSFDGMPFNDELKNIEVARTRKCKKRETKPCLSGKINTKPQFLNGVMYASGAHKGLALEKLLKLLNVKYKAIVFVDDQQKNTSNVLQVYKDLKNTDMYIYLYLKYRD